MLVVLICYFSLNRPQGMQICCWNHHHYHYRWWILNKKMLSLTKSIIFQSNNSSTIVCNNLFSILVSLDASLRTEGNLVVVFWPFFWNISHLTIWSIFQDSLYGRILDFLLYSSHLCPNLKSGTLKFCIKIMEKWEF